MKPSTLLIWEEIPEETKLYVIPNEVADKFKHYLAKAQGNFINGRDWETNEGLKFLNTALSEEDDSVPEPGFEEHKGIFAQYKTRIHTPLTEQHITAVYHTGFLL